MVIYKELNINGQKRVLFSNLIDIRKQYLDYSYKTNRYYRLSDQNVENPKHLTLCLFI